MRIGCCCDIAEAGIAHAAGFDFIECKVISLRPEASDADAADIMAQHRASPLPTAAFNVFLPRDLKIVGPDVDEARIGRYVDTALSRVQQLGAEVVVFGSGAARAIPDGFPHQEAHNQTVKFLQRVADAANRHNLTVVIEPLNRTESNTILSIAEGVELAQAINHPRIRVLADFYHMDEEQEPLAHLTEYSAWLRHIHVADTGRGAPGSGEYPYVEFAERLHQAGYTGTLSIECRWRDFAAEARPAVEFLRRTFNW